MIVTEKAKRDFLINEYHETHNYLINVEKSMFDLLKFYNSVIALVIPISALIFNFHDIEQAYLTILIVAIIVFILGFYILLMYIELRIRKIKTLEQIVIYRERFKDENPTFFNKYLKMISSIKECPPYLRRPSSEWYSVIYISFMEGVSFSAAVMFLLILINSSFYCFNWLGGLKLFAFIILILIILFFISGLLFGCATRYCYIFDLKREDNYKVKNDYSFLDPSPYFPLIFKLLDRLAGKIEEKTRKRYVEKKGE